eukprot:CAMPEP_0183397018 /NCGR_PEP_ID=MMETSP0370-20130417/10318_1 /TAXON_ID=268820 /ORGANISM="Peridinium aciculiferum, Strain PAER-2" /LENGTH=429 /DNA_ID=CAMNT_0025577839 /DNA_START=45 /DNA_END=1334 /DNA_ORIENTATION=+
MAQSAARDALYSRVLQRYPDCPELPALPASSVKWSEADFGLFIESMGLIAPAGQDVCDVDVEEATPTYAAGESHSQNVHIKGMSSAEACLVIPSQIYMEDLSPAGLNIESILTKFDRCRAAALQTICATNLREMADGFGVGILLSDLCLLIESPAPPALISAATVESEIDLPRLPLVPSWQRLVDSSGGVACSATFGQLLVDLKTTRLSTNQEAYKQLKMPCDRIFGRDIPNKVTLAVRGALAEKLGKQHPSQGRLFTPNAFYKGRYVVAPSDCDTYNTLYHPKVPSVCEHACLSTGQKFCLGSATAFFSRFLAPLPPGLALRVHMFVETRADRGARCMYIFEEEHKLGSCALCAFAVYGGPVPGVLYNEEVEACSQKSAQWLLKIEQTLTSGGKCDSAAGWDISQVHAQNGDHHPGYTENVIEKMLAA